MDRKCRGPATGAIRAAPDEQQDVRDSVVKACWSGEVGKVAAQLSLECLLMYNFRVDDKNEAAGAAAAAAVAFE